MSFIGTQELLMILLVAVLVVGPKRLPDLARNLGKGIRNFKKATAKMRADLTQNGTMDELHELKEQVRGLHREIKPLRGQITDRWRNFMMTDDSAPVDDMTPTPSVAQVKAPFAAESAAEPEQTSEAISAGSDIPTSSAPLGFDLPPDNSEKTDREQ
ncbi:MAG: twin-arginine translocase TatA/TatE family subunit [Desulfarculales bacterium]|jgi:sec-independent protein translocase protein TatB|nr:twin-arginine translocase TatA/TatE family subunit [Desulfarculales bacterium]